MEKGRLCKFAQLIVHIMAGSKMITWIGLCAGEIWCHLDTHEEESSLQMLYYGIKAPKETILMALGWLAREGYVRIHGSLPDIRITLNPAFEEKSNSKQSSNDEISNKK